MDDVKGVKSLLVLLNRLLIRVCIFLETEASNQ